MGDFVAGAGFGCGSQSQFSTPDGCVFWRCRAQECAHLWCHPWRLCL